MLTKACHLIVVLLLICVDWYIFLDTVVALLFICLITVHVLLFCQLITVWIDIMLTYSRNLSLCNCKHYVYTLYILSMIRSILRPNYPPALFSKPSLLPNSISLLSAYFWGSQEISANFDFFPVLNHH